MSKLLFDRPPIVFDPELAELFGVPEAVILQQIHYWLQINRKANRSFKHGYFWTFNSYPSWQAQFPFWSVDTIKRALTSLERRGILISAVMNKMKMDRTKWYRIDYEALETQQNQRSVQNALIEEGKMPSPIPETTREAREQQKKVTYLKGSPQALEDISLKIRMANAIEGGNGG